MPRMMVMPRMILMPGMILMHEFNMAKRIVRAMVNGHESLRLFPKLTKSNWVRKFDGIDHHASYKKDKFDTGHVRVGDVEARS